MGGDFNKYFRSARQAVGRKTTQFFSDLTINYGGLQDDQVLFYRKCEENSMIAMLWPWKDNNQVTLKIACFKE